MRTITLLSATALSALVLTAPSAKAGPIGEAAAVGAGVAGFAAGTALGVAVADGYDGYDNYDDDIADVAVRRPYSWGGPEVVGYDLAPAAPTVETEETTIVRRPRTVGRTVIEDDDAASYGYGAAIGERSYGTRAYSREGYRAAGYRDDDAVNERRDYGVRTRVSMRRNGSEGYRRREDFRTQGHVRNEGVTQTRGDIRGEQRSGFRNASVRSNETLGRNRDDGMRGRRDGGIRNVSASGEGMSRGSGTRGTDRSSAGVDGGAGGRLR